MAIVKAIEESGGTTLDRYCPQSTADSVSSAAQLGNRETVGSFTTPAHERHAIELAKKSPCASFAVNALSWHARAQGAGCARPCPSPLTSPPAAARHRPYRVLDGLAHPQEFLVANMVSAGARANFCRDGLTDHQGLRVLELSPTLRTAFHIRHARHQARCLLGASRTRCSVGCYRQVSYRGLCYGRC